MARPAVPARDRFFRHVARGPGGCWLWTGATAAGTEYGVFNRGDGELIGAHRFAWELAHPGESCAGLVVRHDCDRPRCVNPAHLRVGTHADNTADMDARGRRGSNPLHGEEHPVAALSEQLVRHARRAVCAGVSVARIADAFGVSPATVRDAVAGRTWRRVR